MAQPASHEIQVLLTNGKVVQFTLHELSNFIRSKYMLGFVVIFLVGILASNPSVFPAMPEFRLRALYWLVSVFVYLALLPYWVGFSWKIWRMSSRRPIPHLFMTVPFVMPQALLGMYLWSQIGWSEEWGSSFQVFLTATKNTALAHLVEMGAVLWLFPAYREAMSVDDPDKAAEPQAERKFVTLSGRSVPLDQIRFARSAEHYLIVTMDHRTIDLRARMKDFLHQVSDMDGVQTHRSVWVAANEAEELSGNVVRTVSGERLPVSRGRLPAVRDWFERQGKPH